MERYTKEKHFSLLRETSDLVKEELSKIYTTTLDFTDCKLTKQFRIDNEKVVKRRIKENQNFLRPYLTRIALHFSGIDAWYDYKNLLTAIELFNISTYQSNNSFDSKNINTRSNLEYNNQFIISQFSLCNCINYITNCPIISKSDKIFIINQISTANNDVYCGQYIEQNLLNRVDIFDIDEDNFLRTYIERCGFLDGTQFGVSFLIGAFMLDRDIRKLLFSIGRNLGIMLQILGDLEDFILDKKDYSDLKNLRITYPIYLVVNSASKREKFIEYIYERNFSAEFLDELTNSLKNWDVLKKIINQLIILFSELSHKIKKLKSYNLPIEQLDFIFPHIFLSRIIKYFVVDKSSYYKFLKGHFQKEGL